MNINTSPDITVLDFRVLYDLSDMVPRIQLDNASVGAGLNNCTWWYEIMTPSGTFIHKGTETIPDFSNATWNTIVVPDAWPQPFNQIEFSAADYVVTVFVKDSNGSIYQVGKETPICRPSGSTPKTLSNFGAATVTDVMHCDKGQLYVEDTTNYSYQGKAPIPHSKAITLAYPPDDTGIAPAPMIVNNMPNALFDISQNGEGYQVLVVTVMDYDMGADVTVRIKYRYKNQITIACNIDLCGIVCEVNKLIHRYENGGVASREEQDKIIKINTLLVQAIIGKQSPSCGVNVGKVVEEIKRLGGFECGCYTTGSGINGSNNGANINVTINGSCGDIGGEATVVGNNIAITLHDKSYAVAMGTQSASSPFSITEQTVDCQKTYTINVDLAKLVTDIIPELPAPAAPGCCPVFVDVFDHDKDPFAKPDACPLSWLPGSVYDASHTNIIGDAETIDDMIGLINADPTWQAYGTAFNAGNCTVGFYKKDTAPGAVPPVHIRLKDAGGCINNKRNYTAPLFNLCYGSAATYPVNFPAAAVYVQFTSGGTLYRLDNVLSITDAVTRLNALSAKPTTIIFSAVGDVIKVQDNDCSVGNQVTLYLDRPTILALGPNHHSIQPNVGGVYAMDVNTRSQIGYVCKLDKTAYPWHMIRKGNFAYTVESNTGKVIKIDMTNPLFPTTPASFTQLLPPANVSTIVPFSGIPALGSGFPSHWDVYFHTDVNVPVGQFLYIIESTSGCIWKYDTVTDTVVDSSYHQKLLGKCPRVIDGTWLYCTRDGNREDTIPLASGVPKNHLVVVDLLSMTGAGTVTVTSVAVAPAEEEPWTMSMDIVSSTAAIVTDHGTLIQVGIGYPGTAGSNAVPAVMKTSAAGAVGFGFLANIANTTLMDGGNLYLSCLGLGTRKIAWNIFIGVSGTVTSVPFQALITTQGFPNLDHYNFCPIPGACYGVVCYDNGTDPGGLAIFGMDGSFMGLADLNGGDIYNVVFFTGVVNPTPNGYCV